MGSTTGSAGAARSVSSATLPARATRPSSRERPAFIVPYAPWGNERLPVNRPRVAGESLALAITALFRTMRVETIGNERALDQARHGRALIFVGWHGHDLMHLGAFRLAFPRARAAIIVRSNGAGLALGYAAARLKADVIRLGLDPSAAGSARGIVRFIGLVRAGRFGLIAVDGPEGPAEQVKPGAALIALRADALLVPCAAAARPAWRMRRWDRQLVPLPFSRGVVVMGAPIETRTGSRGHPDTGTLTCQIADGLDEVARQARALTRREPVR